MARVLMYSTGVCPYCVMAKRFQDMGKTGKMAAIPYGVSLLVQIFALITSLGIMGASNGGLTAWARSVLPPCQPPSTFSTRSRPVYARARRKARSVAALPELTRKSLPQNFVILR